MKLRALTPLYIFDVGITVNVEVSTLRSGFLDLAWHVFVLVLKNEVIGNTYSRLQNLQRWWTISENLFRSAVAGALSRPPRQPL